MDGFKFIAFVYYYIFMSEKIEITISENKYH